MFVKAATLNRKSAGDVMPCVVLYGLNGHSVVGIAGCGSGA